MYDRNKHDNHDINLRLMMMISLKITTILLMRLDMGIVKALKKTIIILKVLTKWIKINRNRNGAD